MRLPGVCSRANTVVVGLKTLLGDVHLVTGSLPKRSEHNALPSLFISNGKVFMKKENLKLVSP
ncbi:hypothetical protein Slin_6000 [Spirosoma linguale DSM 74]|uniref:Uncharacterized protein n=1 Tax=Spirosoma linguale (strain ATCC 33905 / DSM 74 / LMG 10896 / Claus 1) TaxID=504472 RepID=D2QT30_SPILD|nr:hypothetical protein Slin_6000 [Spirosoma linguale DSM 74]